MGNPGITKANEAAKKIGAPMVFPTFSDSTKASDFNDLATLEGLPVVTMQLRDTGKRRKNTAPDRCHHILDRLAEDKAARPGIPFDV